MSDPTLLVVAKAPVPGLAKTRIGAEIGDEVAADLAAAALLDTLRTARDVGWRLVVAMTGDVRRAARRVELVTALDSVTIVDQRGDGLGERLAHAHTDAAGGGAVVQVGMDTPQLTVDDYLVAGCSVTQGDRAIGPADDGGWWLLGLPDAAEARALAGVPMSTPHTCAATEAAIGDPVIRLRTVRDMDTWADALAIANETPGSHLAQAVREVLA